VDTPQRNSFDPINLAPSIANDVGEIRVFAEARVPNDSKLGVESDRTETANGHPADLLNEREGLYRATQMQITALMQINEQVRGKTPATVTGDEHLQSIPHQLAGPDASEAQLENPAKSRDLTSRVNEPSTPFRMSADALARLEAGLRSQARLLPGINRAPPNGTGSYADRNRNSSQEPHIPLSPTIVGHELGGCRSLEDGLMATAPRRERQSNVFAHLCLFAVAVIAAMIAGISRLSELELEHSEIAKVSIANSQHEFEPAEILPNRPVDSEAAPRTNSEAGSTPTIPAERMSSEPGQAPSHSTTISRSRTTARRARRSFAAYRGQRN
jgi:hypothetical protein